MASTRNGTQIDEPKLKELYKLSIDHLRYQHGDVWRGQQFYTTLNISIIGVAVTLLRLGGQGTKSATLTLFVIGTLTSLFGLLTVRRLRIYYLEAAVHKTLVEYLLHYRSELTAEDVKGRELAVPWVFPKEDILKNPKCWISRNIWRWGGVTFYFMILQLVFIILNIMIGSLVAFGLL
ncbi:MAG: hypothetical protein H3Z52_12560 [archaeon]|nr:hypothetical protein [archaeon]